MCASESGGSSLGGASSTESSGTGRSTSAGGKPSCERAPDAAASTCSCDSSWSSKPQPQCLRRRGGEAVCLPEGACSIDVTASHVAFGGEFAHRSAHRSASLDPLAGEAYGRAARTRRISRQGRTSMGPKVFISYRHEEAAGHARPICEAMEKRFGPRNVFMDLGLRPGEHFGSRIEQRAEDCHVLLAIIGPRWGTVGGKDGRPRLEDPDDWVRREVETGLRRPDVRVIPVLVGGARVPDEADLPDSLTPLLDRHAEHLNEQSW